MQSVHFEGKVLLQENKIFIFNKIENKIIKHQPTEYMRYVSLDTQEHSLKMYKAYTFKKVD